MLLHRKTSIEGEAFAHQDWWVARDLSRCCVAHSNRHHQRDMPGRGNRTPRSGLHRRGCRSPSDIITLHRSNACRLSCKPATSCYEDTACNTGCARQGIDFGPRIPWKRSNDTCFRLLRSNAFNALHALSRGEFCVRSRLRRQWSQKRYAAVPSQSAFRPSNRNQRRSRAPAALLLVCANAGAIPILDDEKPASRLEALGLQCDLKFEVRLKRQS
jgi:hypothetical protein